MSQTFEHIQVVYQMQKLTESVAKSPQFRTLEGNRRRRMELLGQNLYIREQKHQWDSDSRSHIFTEQDPRTRRFRSRRQTSNCDVAERRARAKQFV